MVVCHVAGTARRGQDGVTRVLYEYLERHRAAGLEPVIVTAVADPVERQRFQWSRFQQCGCSVP